MIGIRNWIKQKQITEKQRKLGAINSLCLLSTNCLSLCPSIVQGLKLPTQGTVVNFAALYDLKKLHMPTLESTHYETLKKLKDQNKQLAELRRRMAESKKQLEKYNRRNS